MTKQSRTEAPRKHQEIGRSRTEMPFPGGISRCSCLPAHLNADTDRCRDSLLSPRWQPLLLSPPLFLSYCQRDGTGGKAKRGHFTPVGSDECHWVVPDTTTATGTPSSNQVIGGWNIKWIMNVAWMCPMSYDVTYAAKLYTFASAWLCDTWTCRTGSNLYALWVRLWLTTALMTFTTCRGNARMLSTVTPVTLTGAEKSSWPVARVILAVNMMLTSSHGKHLDGWVLQTRGGQQTGSLLLSRCSFLSAVVCCVSGYLTTTHEHRRASLTL